MEPLQRRAPVLARLPGPRAGLRGATRPRSRRAAAGRAGRRAGAGARAVALRVPAARPGSLVARPRRLDPAARALARARAARRRAGRLLRLHRAGMGDRLLPPAHWRAVDERPAFLAARADELGSDERQRPR